MTKKVIIASSGSGFSSISQKDMIEQFKNLPTIDIGIDIGIDEIKTNPPILTKSASNKRNHSTNKYAKKRA